VEAEQRGGEVDERGRVRDLGVAEEARAADVSGAVLGVDAPPVVRALQGERRVLGDFKFDDDEAAVAA
jgi:hypothetical protein